MYLNHADPFINYKEYLTNHDCYQYFLPNIECDSELKMPVDVLENNLTLIWNVTINGTTEVIDKSSDQYTLKDHNKVAS